MSSRWLISWACRSRRRMLMSGKGGATCRPRSEVRLRLKATLLASTRPSERLFLGHETHTRLDGIMWCARRERVAVESHVAALHGIRAEDQPHRLAAAEPTRPPKPSTSPLCRSKLTPRTALPRRRFRTLSAISSLPGGSDRGRGGEGLRLVGADDRLDEAGAVKGGAVDLRGQQAVSKGGHAVAEAGYLIEPVRDVTAPRRHCSKGRARCGTDCRIHGPRGRPWVRPSR